MGAKFGTIQSGWFHRVPTSYPQIAQLFTDCVTIHLQTGQSHCLKSVGVVWHCQLASPGGCKWLQFCEQTSLGGDLESYRWGSSCISHPPPHALLVTKLARSTPFNCRCFCSASTAIRCTHPLTCFANGLGLALLARQVKGILPTCVHNTGVRSMV